MTPLNAHIPTVTTDRLILRAATRADFDAFASMLADERTKHMGGPFDRPGAWRLFTAGLASWALDGYGAWIVIRTDDGSFLGEIGITRGRRFPEPELGWTLTAQAEGHGYALESSAAARDWYWRSTGATTLVSYVDVANDRSAALARRLGAEPDPDGPWPEGETADDTTVFRHRRAA